MEAEYPTVNHLFNSVEVSLGNYPDCDVTNSLYIGPHDNATGDIRVLASHIIDPPSSMSTAMNQELRFLQQRYPRDVFLWSPLAKEVCLMAWSVISDNFCVS